MANKPTPNEGGAQRAARLREQIKRIKDGARAQDSEPETPPEKLSPHEFIERRMRELDQKKK